MKPDGKSPRSRSSSTLNAGSHLEQGHSTDDVTLGETMGERMGERMAETIEKTPERVISLWPHAPQALANGPEDCPQLTVHLAAIPNGCGVIVCPGGGYRTLASDHEGLQVAQWLNGHGIHAFVLRYRLGPRYHSSVSRLDGQRAMRVLRFHAQSLGLDPQRLGMLGFSAGGHLILAAALSASSPSAEIARDEIDALDCRPNFLVPLYAVTNGERRGRKADEYPAMDSLVDGSSPPTFLLHSHEDSIVPASQSTLLYDALLAARVPAELHIFNFGDHGLGLDRGADAGHMDASPWGTLLLHWLRRHGLLLDQSSPTQPSHGGRCALHGEVLVGGEPVALGWLTWLPEDNNAPIARVRLTGASAGRFTLGADAGPVPGAHRLVLHVVSAIYPADASGDYSQARALMFERQVQVAPGEALIWHIERGDGSAL